MVLLMCASSIGDWYPERNVFQILIAITSGPRFALVFLQYFITRTSRSTLPRWVFLAGTVRTLACGGWVYITSNDDHDVHDVLMVLYIVCNVPWMLGGIVNTPPSHVQVRKRRFVSLFFSCQLILIPHSQATRRCSASTLANQYGLLLTFDLVFLRLSSLWCTSSSNIKYTEYLEVGFVFLCHLAKLTLS
jgi:hypothetical protein